MKRLHPWSLLAIALVLLGMSFRDDGGKSNKNIPKASNGSEVSPNYEVRRFGVQFSYGDDSIEQNVYLLFDRTSKQGIIIDPGARSQELETEIASSGITIKGILNTHGHPDHTGANGVYGSKYQAKVYAHSSDEPFYQLKIDEPTRWITEECDLRLGAVKVHVLHTPGHSPGSVCFLVGHHLFSGDTLFQGSIGRTYDESATGRLVDNIRKKLLTLHPETLVYPGHGELTTIAIEKKGNPFLQDGQQDAEGDAVNRAP